MWPTDNAWKVTISVLFMAIPVAHKADQIGTNSVSSVLLPAVYVSQNYVLLLHLELSILHLLVFISLLQG